MIVWQKEHERVVNEFLEYLNLNSKDFVLKDDTALIKGYGLECFSEDICLDAQQGSRIREIVAAFCVTNGYEYKEVKNTVATEKYTIHYHHDYKPLEISVSYRATAIDQSICTNIGNILIYEFNPLLMMKITTYMGRNKTRDLYDIAFMCNKHFKSLLPETTMLLQNMWEYKGLVHFDYIIHTQKDELVDLEKLKNEVINMCNNVELPFNNN